MIYKAPKSQKDNTMHRIVLWWMICSGKLGESCQFIPAHITFWEWTYKILLAHEGARRPMAYSVVVCCIVYRPRWWAICHGKPTVYYVLCVERQFTERDGWSNKNVWLTPVRKLVARKTSRR